VILIYSGALLLNDYCDRAEDLADRPNRPIPSGAASPRTVLLVAVLLHLLGPALAMTAGWAAGAAALLLSAAAALYDLAAKRHLLAGPVVMGLCRAGSVAVGAVAAAGTELPAPVLPALLTAFLYTLAITVVAARETRAGSPGTVLALPPTALAVGLGAGLYLLPALNLQALCLLPIALALVFVMLGARRVAAGTLPTPPFIGRMIREMILIQGAWCLLGLWGEGRGALVLAGALVILLRLSAGFAGKKFYGS
jgi:4-hydroxybenzoate polyprenyltransferase